MTDNEAARLTEDGPPRPSTSWTDSRDSTPLARPAPELEACRYHEQPTDAADADHARQIRQAAHARNEATPNPPPRGGLTARRAAAVRLPPLPDGRRDPLDSVSADG